MRKEIGVFENSVDESSSVEASNAIYNLIRA